MRKDFLLLIGLAVVASGCISSSNTLDTEKITYNVPDDFQKINETRESNITTYAYEDPLGNQYLEVSIWHNMNWSQGEFRNQSEAILSLMTGEGAETQVEKINGEYWATLRVNLTAEEISGREIMFATMRDDTLYVFDLIQVEGYYTTTYEEFRDSAMNATFK